MIRKLVVAAMLGTSTLGAIAYAQSHEAAPAPASSTPAAADPAKANPAKANPNAPAFGRYGFDEGGMDRKIAPGDDFFGYADGEWARTTPIPADKAAYGAFNLLDDLSRERTRTILDQAKADPKSRIGAVYASFLDTATIEAKGLTPIKPWLDEIKAANSKADYVALAAHADRMGVSVPIETSVDQDDKENTQYAVLVRQGGLGMPDRDYYLQAEFAKQRADYLAHLTKLLTLAGEPDADARAQAVMAFETGIAKVHWTQIENRDANKNYNKRTLVELTNSAPGFGFATYLKLDGIAADAVVVAQPPAVAGIAKAIDAAPLAVLKDQLLLRSLDSYASVLPTVFDKERFAFYGTALSGTPEQSVRWKRAVDFTSRALADDVSKIYVARYFPPATKAAADQLVKNIIAAMNTRLDQLDWMSPETKVKAHQKLANFTPKIGYPSQWHDYSSVRVSRSDAFGNLMRTREWQHDWDAQKLGKPILRWEWGMTPMTINAYANPPMVEIVFPAAILQPPFFDPKADPAINYGGIGAVIGHEMSHHFDDQGSEYDVTGRLSKWWTDEDRAKFKARTSKLVAQYDAYEPFPGVHVQGALTLGENIADLAGLTVAYDAYHRSLGAMAAPVIDGMTGDQRFYLGWAQVWRDNIREKMMRQLIVVDPHSPPPLRVATVRNLDAWYAAFDAKPGQKLYLAPEQRVRIW